MNRDKQIEEMAKAVCHLDRTCDECMTSFECKAMTYAKRFYNAGYRKASEIFEEIEDVLNNIGYFDELDFKALKKKYSESEKDNE